jgi:hypothetical protein
MLGRPPQRGGAEGRGGAGRQRLIRSVCGCGACAVAAQADTWALGAILYEMVTGEAVTCVRDVRNVTATVRSLLRRA